MYPATLLNSLMTSSSFLVALLSAWGNVLLFLVCWEVSLRMGFSVGLDSKESTCNAGNIGLIPGSGISQGKCNGYPTPVLIDLENSMDRATWQPQSMGLLRVWHDWVTNTLTFHEEWCCILLNVFSTFVEMIIGSFFLV